MEIHREMRHQIKISKVATCLFEMGKSGFYERGGGGQPIASKMALATKKIAPKILAVMSFNNDSEPLSVRK